MIPVGALIGRGIGCVLGLMASPTQARERVLSENWRNHPFDRETEKALEKIADRTGVRRCGMGWSEGAAEQDGVSDYSLSGFLGRLRNKYEEITNSASYKKLIQRQRANAFLMGSTNYAAHSAIHQSFFNSNLFDRHLVTEILSYESGERPKKKSLKK